MNDSSDVRQALIRLSKKSLKVGFNAGHTAATVAAIAAASNQRSKFKARDWDDAIDAVVAAIEALGGER